VEEGIDLLAPYAAEMGVKLGIEPFHPALMTERSVIVTLAQALDIAERFDPDQVGVVVDVYHVFWDPDLYSQIARASGRILGFHVNDWVVSTRDPLLERGMMGDGVIELRRIRAAVDDGGYAGLIEVSPCSGGLTCYSTQSKFKTRVPACAVAPVVEQEPRLYADTEQPRKIYCLSRTFCRPSATYL
jgi:sugar phosphate isomerase/epimerase